MILPVVKKDHHFFPQGRTGIFERETLRIDVVSLDPART